NWGTACNAQNPNAVCPKPKIPPVDCFALSRDMTYVQPVYDAAWQSTFSWSNTEDKIDSSLNSPNYGADLYFTAAFQKYLSDLKYCQKHHPEYTYWTYARVHPAIPIPSPKPVVNPAVNYVGGPN
ncbi:hypothetical protein HDU84_000811, partial [Entophlyctis sp. JEL0112]